MIETLAQKLYEKAPVLASSDPDESWVITWKDIKDFHPEIYDSYVQEAYLVLKRSCRNGSR